MKRRGTGEKEEAVNVEGGEEQEGEEDERDK